MITKEQLQGLAAVEASPMVSIYLPTHERGREVRQDPIRLKNGLAAAAEKLEAAGHRRPDVEGLLAPAYALVEDERFWRYQGKGLAVFLGPDFFQHHRLPIEVREVNVVGRRPHLKPLMPLFAHDGRFYVVAATAGETRLFEGSRFGLSEIEADLPEGVASSVGAQTEYENSEHASPPARPRAGAPVGMPASHTFGESPEDQRKTQLLEYLRRVQAALEASLSGDRAPVVLVAPPEVGGHLRSLPHGLPFLDEGVQADPSSMDEETLHERAYEVVRPDFAKAQAEALDQFRALRGDGDARAGTDLEAIVSGAVFGRVDKLFAVRGKNIWGRFDKSANKVHLDGEDTGDNEDLLDLAAVQTLVQGGQVIALEPTEMPAEGPLCAVYRY